MKKLFTLLLCIFAFAACSKEDKESPNLTTGSLTQTEWKGTLAYKQNGQTVRDNVSFKFVSENTGWVELKLYNTPGDGTVDKGYFSYKTEGNRLTLRLLSIYSFLDGDWTVAGKSKKKLKLKKAVQSTNDTYTIDIEKIY